MAYTATAPNREPRKDAGILLQANAVMRNSRARLVSSDPSLSRNGIASDTVLHLAYTATVPNREPRKDPGQSAPWLARLELKVNPEGQREGQGEEAITRADSRVSSKRNTRADLMVNSRDSGSSRGPKRGSMRMWVRGPKLPRLLGQGAPSNAMAENQQC